MSSLFNIRQDHLSLLSLIEANEGVLSEEELKAFELNQEDFEAKAVSYAYIIKKYQAESNTIKSEIDRLAKLKKTADNAVDRFKQMLKDAMIQFGVDKIDGDTIKIGFRKSKKLELTDELIEIIKTKISATTRYIGNDQNKNHMCEFSNDEHIEIEDYLKINIEVDKTRLKAAIEKEGVEIEGAAVNEEKTIQIR